MLLFKSLIFVIFCFSRYFALSPISNASSTTPSALSINISSTVSSTTEAEANNTQITTSTPSEASKTSIVPQKNEAAQKCFNEKEGDQYLCFLNLRTKNDWENGLSDKLIRKIDKLEDPRKVYHIPGISDSGIVITAVVLALLILIGNGAAIGYFFRWNFKPLSRRPTDDELDDVLDADLPVILINHGRQAQVNEFQFGAKYEKDTQTVMASDPQQQTEQQQSSMPDELKSVVPDNQDGGMPAGALLPAPAPIPAAGTPRRAGGGKRGGARGGAGGRRGGGGRGGRGRR